MTNKQIEKLLQESAELGDRLSTLGEISLHTAVKVAVRAGENISISEGAVVTMITIPGREYVGVLFDAGHYSEFPLDYPCLVPESGRDPQQIKRDFQEFQSLIEKLQQASK